MSNKLFEIKWTDLTENTKKEYLKFFKVNEPMEDKKGNLILEKEV